MDIIPVETLHNILSYICEVHDVVHCMLVSTYWNDCVKYLNTRYSIDFANGGYRNMIKAVLGCKIIRSNKYMMVDLLKQHPEHGQMLRLIFTNNYAGVLLKCAMAAEKILHTELSKVWKTHVEGMHVDDSSAGNTIGTFVVDAYIGDYSISLYKNEIKISAVGNGIVGCIVCKRTGNMITQGVLDRIGLSLTPPEFTRLTFEFIDKYVL